jgi:hypothetical protein
MTMFPYPVVRDGVLYVPRPAMSDDGRTLGDGYVRLDSLPDEERRQWEAYVSSNLRIPQTAPDSEVTPTAPGAPRIGGRAGAQAPADVTNVTPIGAPLSVPPDAGEVKRLSEEVERLRAALERIAELPDLSLLGAVRRMAQAALDGEPIGNPSSEQ